MPVKIVSGDPLLTDADILAFGHNARGRTEMGDLETALMRAYPAAFSTYRRRARQNKQKAGTFWYWTESRPKLLFLTVRDSSVGATRLRYVQSVLLTIARDYALYGWQNMALVLPGNQYERGEILQLCETWLAPSTLPIVLYESYVPGLKA
ncbi:MAG: hypothetical protein ACPG7F_08975, partial [Aggregatilineales bacterium]